MVQDEVKWEDLEVKIFAFTFENLERARIFAQGKRLSIPLILDPKREVYDFYGLKKGSFRQIWTPAGIARFFRAFFQRDFFQKELGPSDDIYQLGGDVLLDSKGRCHWIWRSANPEDRPRISQIMEVIENLNK